MFLAALLAASFVGFGPRTQAAPPPQTHFATLTPSRGHVNGGTLVSLNGEGFDALPPGVLGVLFGDDPATDVHLVSPTLITAVSPPHKHGQVYVKISLNGDGMPGFGRRGFTYDDDANPGSTTTTTTQPGATTTTTTLPCSNCSDGDACTLDTCVSNTCQHAETVSPAELLGQATACSGQTLPPAIGARFGRGCQLVTEARSAAGPGAARRQYKAAIRAYARALRATRRASHRHNAPLTPGCAGGLEGLLESARAHAKALKGS